MEEYLAKADETLEEHTLRLLENYQLLKKLYPTISVDWELLKLAATYHDCGKINKNFQYKIRKNLKKVDGEVPHGHLSIGFIDYKNLPETSYDNKNIKDYSRLRPALLAAAIYFHHKRDNIANSIEEIREKLKEALEELKNIDINFKAEELQGIKPIKVPSTKIIEYDLSKIYSANIPNFEREERYLEFVKLKGLLNKLDFAASAHENIEFQNDFLEGQMNNFLNKLKVENPMATWNELQEFMKKNRDKNIVAIAQTGMGKTEAGLLWIGNNKGFFTLPLKTAINAIYERILEYTEEGISKRIALLHSDTALQYLAFENKIMDREDDYNFEDYLVRTRQLSMPLTVCTIDQVLDFVYKYLGSEMKLATLAYSKLIIDEIQMYSPELLGVIITALKWITRAGGKFSILTATMPPFLSDLMKKNKISFLEPKPFINNKIRHSIKVFEDNINADIIAKKFNNNKILVICNTVKETQRLYNELSEMGLEKSCHLFHGSFILRDKRNIEKEILVFTNKNNKSAGIWICTQVVEASLDIDFDLLITELSDINGLFQRLGRCFRNRSFDKDGYNCFIFVGSAEDYPSGIGYVVDKDIFKLSKIEILKYDGKISEEEKLNIINKVYNTENIETTEYYKKIIRSMKNLDMVLPDEIDKIEVNRLFRNINTIDIIPANVLNENKKEIDKNIEIIKKSNDKFSNEKEAKKEKIKAKKFIESFTVAIPYYVFAKVDIKILEVTKNFTIPVVNLEYSFKFGISKIENTEENIEDLMAYIV